MNKKKSIIFFINHLAFFVSHRLPIAKKLLKSGYDVKIICGQFGNLEMENHAILEIEKCKIKYIRLSFKPSGMNPFIELYSILQLIYYLIIFKPSTLHCISPKAVLYGSIASNVARIKSLVVAISGMGHLFLKDKHESFLRIVFRKIYISLLKINFKLTKKLVVIVQNNDDKYLIENSISEKNNVHLIQGSGVDLNEFDNINFENKKKIVLLVSRMLKEKGVLEFIEAAKTIKNLHPNWRFILVGAADYDNPSAISKKFLNVISSDGMVEWHGHSSSIKDYMKEASIVCLPSYREGMPKVLLEAAAAGCATVTTNVPGCREAIQNNVTGTLVELNNQKALNSAILNLINNKEMRERYGKNGIDLAIKRFGIDSVVDKHLEIYNMLEN